MKERAVLRSQINITHTLCTDLEKFFSHIFFLEKLNVSKSELQNRF